MGWFKSSASSSPSPSSSFASLYKIMESQLLVKLGSSQGLVRTHLFRNLLLPVSKNRVAFKIFNNLGAIGLSAVRH